MSNIRLLLLDIMWSFGTSKSNVVRWPSSPFKALPAPLDEHIVMHGKPLMDKLKFIDMRGSHNFTKTLEFSRVPFLEHLRISGCPSLVEVHSSLGKLEKLAQVWLDCCENLKILPTKLETNSLIMLCLQGSRKVAMLPEFGEGMQKLSYLDVEDTAITTLPESLGHLTSLRYLGLTGCKVSNLGKVLKTCIIGEISGLNVTWLTELDVSYCGLSDRSIPDDFGSLSSLIAFDLSYNDFVNLPTGCFSRLSRLVFLSLDWCRSLKSLPRLPPQLIRLQAFCCDSMEPLSDRQSWNLVASLNHEYRGRTKYVISYEECGYEEYEDMRSVSEHDEAKCLLPLRDFCTFIPQCEIPSWFSNKEDCHQKDYSREYVIKVNISPSLRDSEWSGLVVCFNMPATTPLSVFSWSTKAAEDDDCICKEWAHYVDSMWFEGAGYLCIMVLELNEETCWQHLRAPNNTLHIKFVGSFTTHLQGCGWRVICKEEIQKWCNDNDFNQLTQSQLATPHDEINLPSTVFHKFIRKWCNDNKRLEAGLIKNIVGDVWTCLSPELPSHDDNLVGIESRVNDMVSILEIGLDDKCFVGIWGISGVGKTTLARVVFEKLSYKFEVCCFLANVRETLLQRDGLVSLQRRLMSHLKIKDTEIYDAYEGMKMIRKLFCYKKVLLVLDDVDDMGQLKNLAESPHWFGKGTRILITTRDSHLLTAFGVQRLYDMKTMKIDESLQLFLKKAFNEDYPKKDYLELSKFVVKYARGLPLALKVLGSYFHGRSKAEWIDALNRLKQVNPGKSILEVLKISYDGLDENEQTIFLDVVCFFKHWQKKEVTQILRSCDLLPTIGIKVLIEKALLVETKDCRLEMHDLIEELGRCIVHQESLNDVCKRSRLWEFKDIKEVLENNKGSEAIQAIVMQDNYENQGRIKVHPEAFSKLSSIRLLLLKDMEADSPHILPKEFKLPASLEVFQWPSFPFESHALWNVKPNVIQPMKMKFIDMSNSEYFIETPDFSGVPCLEHLCLRGCTSLVKVHPSLGELKELVEMDLHGCINLKMLPRKLKTNSLVKLDLGGCIKVVVLPEFEKSMKKLSYLDVSYTAITRLPNSLGSLTGLRDLNLRGCQICNLDMLKIHVTRQISGLNVTSLTELCLSGCGLNDGLIPDNFGSLSSLIILDLSHNDFVNLPTACFSSLFRLLFLSLDYCGNLKSLPRLPPRLVRLNASHCYSMEPLSSDRQLWNLVASLDHKCRGQTKYVISDEEYEDTPSMSKHIELEHLPLGDFFANIPGYTIPSWFPNEYVPTSVPNWEHVIEVKIPPSLRDSEWSGIVVCLHISDDFSGLISWSSKAPENDDYMHKEWAHCSTIWNRQNHHLCIMVLELNEKTCWQHLKAGDNSLHIKLYAHNDRAAPSSAQMYAPYPISKLECGWRVIRKEEIKDWCRRNNFNQLTPPQLPPPHDEVKLPLRVLDKFNGSVYFKWSDV